MTGFSNSICYTFNVVFNVVIGAGVDQFGFMDRSAFYNVELHRWPYRESFLAEIVMPLGGRYLAYVWAFALLICLLASFRLISRLYKYCRQMIFFLIASLSGPVVVVLLKNFTHTHSRGAIFSIAHEVPIMRCSVACISSNAG
ncbi:MAG: hypothetical protein ACXV9T_16670 [Methylobacter sp.]